MVMALFERGDATGVLAVGTEVVLYDPRDRALIAVNGNAQVPIALDVARVVRGNGKLWLRMMDGSVQKLVSTSKGLESSERQAWADGLIGIADDGTEAFWRYGETARIENPSAGVSWCLDATWVACRNDCVLSLTEHSDGSRQLQEFDLHGARRWSFTSSQGRSGRADHNRFPVFVGTDCALLNCGTDDAGNGEIVCVRRTDGRALWTKNVPGLCGITVLEGMCAVAALDRFELWSAKTGESLSSQELAGFRGTLAALTERQLVVVGERGSLYVADRASPHAGIVDSLPGNFVAAIEPGIFGPPGSFAVTCLGPQQFGSYRREGLLIGGGSVTGAVDLISIPRIPWHRVETADDVEYHILLGAMSRYEAVQSARVSVRETFYAVGRESRFDTRATFDAEHGGSIILEYSGDDARAFADLERVAAEETVWADEMALRAGTGASFVVTARKP